jgi:hypothetical protein
MIEADLVDNRQIPLHFYKFLGIASKSFNLKLVLKLYIARYLGGFLSILKFRSSQNGPIFHQHQLDP